VVVANECIINKFDIIIENITVSEKKQKKIQFNSIVVVIATIFFKSISDNNLIDK